MSGRHSCSRYSLATLRHILPVSRVCPVLHLPNPAPATRALRQSDTRSACPAGHTPARNMYTAGSPVRIGWVVISRPDSRPGLSSALRFLPYYSMSLPNFSIRRLDSQNHRCCHNSNLHHSGIADTVGLCTPAHVRLSLCRCGSL